MNSLVFYTKLHVQRNYEIIKTKAIRRKLQIYSKQHLKCTIGAGKHFALLPYTLHRKVVHDS